MERSGERQLWIENAFNYVNNKYYQINGIICAADASGFSTLNYVNNKNYQINRIICSADGSSFSTQLCKS
jgi:hypothetical protein